MSSLCGRATESLQLETMLRAKAAGSGVDLNLTSSASPAPKSVPTSWWFLGPGGQPLKADSNQIQSLINESCQDIQICPDGGNAWIKASEAGFQIPLPPSPVEKEVSDDLTARNPAEEALEMYPDSDLSAAGVKHNLFPPGTMFDRKAVIRGLAQLGITTL